MITIVIQAYEICTENVIKMIVCLEPGRGIDRHADELKSHPFLVHFSDMFLSIKD